MKSLLKRRSLLIGITAIIILIIILSRGSDDESSTWTTDTVTKGEVAEIVSVSGIVEADDHADLSFPTSGIVETVPVRPGDTVTKGQVLATLEQAELLADRGDAYGALLTAEANRAELVSGPRGEERDVTSVTVAIAEENLKRVIAEENEKVENAYRALLSSDLEALPADQTNDNVPPTISGTYTCGREGTYTLGLFRSNAQSGTSYRLSGLETGTYTAYTEAPAALGTCGLRIQFDATEIYSSKEWLIEVPNTRSSSYVTNLNTYELAAQQRENAVTAAEQALLKARKEQTLENASPRSEALDRANASVIQAEARLAAVNARIEERTLRAPFDGVISDVDVVPGEAAGSGVAITLVADTVYELSVRIPEIDITKLKVGQSAEITFDARTEEVVEATISFISPVATMIDGVAYFEAKLQFTTPPEWLRGGLNADVDIIIERKEDVLRIPKRFLIEESGAHFVLVPTQDGKTTERVSVELGFVGNNGHVEVTGLSEGSTIVAP